MAEAQPTPDPGLVRVGQRMGHLLSAAAAAAATASLLLLASPAAAPLSAAAAALSAAGSVAEVVEAQPTPDSGLVRVAQRMGHQLSAAATASLLLLASPAAAPLSTAAAALPAAGSWADCSHRGLLSLLLWGRNGGHRHHHVGVTICRDSK